jgi:hypothetical protein
MVTHETGTGSGILRTASPSEADVMAARAATRELLADDSVLGMLGLHASRILIVGPEMKVPDDGYFLTLDWTGEPWGSDTVAVQRGPEMVVLQSLQVSAHKCTADGRPDRRSQRTFTALLDRAETVLRGSVMSVPEPLLRITPRGRGLKRLDRSGEHVQLFAAFDVLSRARKQVREDPRHQNGRGSCPRQPVRDGTALLDLPPWTACGDLGTAGSVTRNGAAPSVN